MWQNTLQQIVAYYASGNPPIEPTFFFDAEPPRLTEWPQTLPICEGLFKFYQICGRGDFGPLIRFIPLEELSKQTTRWIETLRDYDTRGDILHAGKHIVFANDPDGTPWIWDSSTGRVASFYWKGGDWQEPSFASFDDFMEYILSPRDEYPSWAKALGVYMKRAK